MKSIKLLYAMPLIFAVLFFGGCQTDEVLNNTENKVNLKSTFVVPVPNCDPQTFQLVTSGDVVTGEMRVSNNDEYLVVEFIAGEAFIINEMQLWVGTSIKKVPVNKQKIPNPQKFNHKGLNSDNIFLIRLSDLYPVASESVQNGKKLYLMAHVVADIGSTTETEEISAWSEGSPFGNSKNVSYSTYATCTRSTGGGGCFPHTAWGGATDGGNSAWFYYDNTTGGQQAIYADNGVIAGAYVEWNSGTITISLPQDWQLGELTPQVKIQGYMDKPTSPPETYSFNESKLSVAVGYSNYYIIHLDLQNCYAGNP